MKPIERLVCANLAAQSAEQIALAAAPIFAVLLLGLGAGEVGWLHTAQTLPFLLFAIPAGLLADRFARKQVMLYGELVRVLALLAILLLAYLQLLNGPLLAGLGFIAACGTVAFSVSAPALVPALVDRERLAAANTRIELARTIAFTAGPALGGLLVGWSGAALAFAVAAILSVLATLFLAGLAEPARMSIKPAERKPWTEIREGADFVIHHALLRPVFLTQFVFSTALFLLMAAYVPHAADALGLNASMIGLTLSAYGFGMIAGALIAPRLQAKLPFGVLVQIGPVCGLLAALTMVLTLWLPSAPIAAASFFLLGIGPINWVISTTTLRQRVTPTDLLGRVSAINILSYGARPLGAALAGLLGGAFGAGACLVAAALLFLIQVLIIARSPVAGLRALP